ncbi:MAG: hypothetical protein FWG90_06995 [Oscillospiraceae bacterium]|nr:hypothetical protein [Oscillospiraceae bacterium]
MSDYILIIIGAAINLLTVPILIALCITLGVQNKYLKKRVAELENMVIAARVARNPRARSAAHHAETTSDGGLYDVPHNMYSAASVENPPMYIWFHEKAQNPAPAKKTSGAINVVLTVGAVFMVLSGVMLSSASWGFVNDAVRVAVLLVFSAIFFAMSSVSERKLELPVTGMAFYTVGCLFPLLAPKFGALTGGAATPLMLIPPALLASSTALIIHRKERKSLLSGVLALQLILLANISSRLVSSDKVLCALMTCAGIFLIAVILKLLGEHHFRGVFSDAVLTIGMSISVIVIFSDLGSLSSDKTIMALAASLLLLFLLIIHSFDPLTDRITALISRFAAPFVLLITFYPLLRYFKHFTDLNYAFVSKLLAASFMLTVTVYCILKAFSKAEIKRKSYYFSAGLIFCMVCVYLAAEGFMVNRLTYVNAEKVLTLIIFPSFPAAIYCLISIIHKSFRFNKQMFYIGCMSLSLFSFISAAEYLRIPDLPLDYLSAFAATFILAALFSKIGKLKLPPTIAALSAFIILPEQPFFNIPVQFTSEINALGIMLFFLTLNFIWKSAPNMNKMTSSLVFAAAVVNLWILCSEAVTGRYIFDSLIVLISVFVMLLFSLKYKRKKWFLLSTAATLSMTLLMTGVRSSAFIWWGYFMLTGILLVALGTASEIKRRKGDGENQMLSGWEW